MSDWQDRVGNYVWNHPQLWGAAAAAGSAYGTTRRAYRAVKRNRGAIGRTVAYAATTKRRRTEGGGYTRRVYNRRRATRRYRPRQYHGGYRGGYMKYGRKKKLYGRYSGTFRRRLNRRITNR